jgi:hypothetical protein
MTSRNLLTAAVICAATAWPLSAVLAQNTTTPNQTGAAAPSAAGTEGNPAIRTSASAAQAPAKGANSFTQGQAATRIAGHGFQDVSNLHKDANGVWRGQAKQNGQQVAVWLDFKGNVGTGGSTSD